MIWNPWRELREARNEIRLWELQAQKWDAETLGRERLVETLRHELSASQEDFRRFVTMLGVQVATRPAQLFEPETDPFAERAGPDEWLTPPEGELPDVPALARKLAEDPSAETA